MAHATQMTPGTTATAMPTTIEMYMLFVSDWTRAIAFFRDTMGWTLTFEEPNSWAEFATGGIKVALHPTEAGQTATPVDTHLCFKVEDVDATVKALTARNVKITVQPREVCEGIRAASFVDPFGNTFHFHGK